MKNQDPSERKTNYSRIFWNATLGAVYQLSIDGTRSYCVYCGTDEGFPILTPMEKGLEGKTGIVAINDQTRPEIEIIRKTENWISLVDVARIVEKFKLKKVRIRTCPKNTQGYNPTRANPLLG